MADTCRLLGIPRNGTAAQEFYNAYELGNRRWRDAGSPPPSRVIDLIAQAVHADLLRREMTRPELRSSLGLQYEDINLALDLLRERYMVEMEEDAGGTSHYRASGTPSPVAEKRRQSSTIVYEDITKEEFVDTLKQVSRPVEPELQASVAVEPEPNGRQKVSARRPRGEEEEPPVAKLPPELDAVRRGADQRSLEKRRMRAPDQSVAEEFPSEIMEHVAEVGRRAHEDTVSTVVETLAAEPEETANGRALKPCPNLPLTLIKIENLVAAGITYAALAKRLKMSTPTLAKLRKTTEVGPACERGVDRWNDAGRPGFEELTTSDTAAAPATAKSFRDSLSEVLEAARAELAENESETDSIRKRLDELTKRHKVLTDSFAPIERLLSEDWV